MNSKENLMDKICEEITQSIGPILVGRDNVLAFHAFCLSLTSLGVIMGIKKEQQREVIEHYLETAYEAQKTFKGCQECQKNK